MENEDTILRKKRCMMIYRKIDDGCIVLRDVVPLDRQHLFRVTASYSKRLLPGEYFVLADNKCEAKHRFLNAYGWLSEISGVEMCSQDETGRILSEFYKHPVNLLV